MKRIALLGMPNTGKSTFFNRLTGASARVGNWPGVTVDLLGAKVLVGDAMVEVVDLPGIYDLHGFSDDERVVREFLENNPLDLVVVILNTTQIDRQLGLALQLKELGIPILMLLNMADEARKRGVHVDIDRLSGSLESPVVTLSAKYGQGFPKALEMLRMVLQDSRPVSAAWLRAQLQQDDRLQVEMEHILGHAVELSRPLGEDATARLDRVLLHPWFGLPLFFLAVFLLFQLVYTLGAPLQDGTAWLLEQFKAVALVPLAGVLPGFLYGLLVEGLFDGLGTVASFVPIIVLFFLGMAVVEDSGYLSRAAFIMDAMMSRLGLDGRSFVMLLMGFGCNVPALMGTRVMRTRAMRLLTMLIIPFSLCSARLQVFLFLTTALFAPAQAPLVLFSLYLVSFLLAFLTAWLFRGRYRSQEPFVLELPPYRRPTLRQVFMRGWLEVSHFLRRATTFIVIGVVLVWLLTHLPTGVMPAGPETPAGYIGALFEPLLAPLGIDQQLTVALLFGFVAKEVLIGALAVIYGASGDALMGVMAARMDWVQAYSFMLFTLLYTPCLSTVATLRSESRSGGFTLLALGWGLLVAWLVSAVFYQTARLLGF